MGTLAGMGRPPDFAGFSEVDRTGAAGAYAGYLDDVGSLGAVAEWKRRSFELLEARPGARLVDVGCGTGADVLALAALVEPGGRVLGIDASAEMIQEARRRTGAGAPAVDFRVGDARRLPLPAASFDGCRAERTLQHLGDPAEAVAEMARIVRPGGCVVVAEPDWGTLVIDSTDPDTAGAVAAAAAERVRAGGVGRRLWRLFRDAGLADVAVVARTLVVTDHAQASLLFDLDAAAGRAVADGRVSADVARGWRAGLARAGEEDRFLAAMTAFMARGRRRWHAPPDDLRPRGARRPLRP